MADRLTEVGDIVVAKLIDVWEPAEPDAVQREYGVEADLDTLEGRRVYVFALGDGEAERLDRATVVWEYRLGIVVVERYERAAAGSTVSAAGLPPKEWMDERVEFCRETVLDTLNVDREADYLGTPATLYTQSITRDVAYDFEAYRDDGVFWCEMSLALREKIAG